MNNFNSWILSKGLTLRVTYVEMVVIQAWAGRETWLFALVLSTNVFSGQFFVDKFAVEGKPTALL